MGSVGVKSYIVLEEETKALSMFANSRQENHEGENGPSRTLAGSWKG
jgi:hypothetical protein